MARESGKCHVFWLSGESNRHIHVASFELAAPEIPHQIVACVHTKNPVGIGTQIRPAVSDLFTSSIFLIYTSALDPRLKRQRLGNSDELGENKTTPCVQLAHLQIPVKRSKEESKNVKARLQEEEKEKQLLRECARHQIDQAAGFIQATTTD